MKEPLRWVPIGWYSHFPEEDVEAQGLAKKAGARLNPDLPRPQAPAEHLRQGSLEQQGASKALREPGLQGFSEEGFDSGKWTGLLIGTHLDVEQTWALVPDLHLSTLLAVHPGTSYWTSLSCSACLCKGDPETHCTG